MFSVRKFRHALPTLCIRGNASKGRKNKYSDTLNLPKTDFPLSMKDAAARELSVQEECGFDTLYKWQRDNNTGEEFILHDGPPYANGDPHVGHAVNKILKDITTRYHMLRGRRVHYVPGWDCHGLPIELKALKQGSSKKLSPLQIRSKAKQFAVTSAKTQLESFRRWGVMADWQNQCYYTYTPEYEAQQLDVFYTMFEKGLVYMDVMPVYWSPSSQTALAESELEYNENHTSTSIYVRCQLVQMPSSIQNLTEEGGAVYAVVWTTTPWTIPSNQAICFNSALSYLVVKDSATGNLYICEDSFLEKLRQITNSDLQVQLTVKGTALMNTTYRHPLTGEELHCLHGDHVTAGKGTGLVHTAPAHGHDDFQLARKCGISIKSLLDDRCRYTQEAGQALVGKSVVGTETENTVISLLGDALLHQEKITHSYPYDWRTNKPVIICASRQWFIDTKTLRDKALNSLENVTITPAKTETGMIRQLVERPYWCISRQRVWGVPIPVFYSRESREPLLNRWSFDHVRSLIAQHGSDCWWSLSDEELLPTSMLKQHGLGTSEEYERGQDILDIWFDSGTSWAAVVDPGQQADVYMEGTDQFGGWFQSSLLTSVATQDRAPYKQLVVHGFTMDEEGRKMSKSLGNVVDPRVVINGGKDKSQPAYGADTLRWWAAQTSLQSHSSIGPTKLSRAREELFELRKMLRYLLGNINVRNQQALVPYTDLLPQDKYMLHILYTTLYKIPDLYESYQFNKVLQTVEKFHNEHVSKFYSTITKDRCYCGSADGLPRQSALTTQFYLLDTMVRALAPVVPHLAEELYQHYPPHRHKQGGEGLFRTGWFSLPPEWNNNIVMLTFDPVLDIVDHFNDILAAESPTEFDLIIYSSSLLHNKLKELQPEPTSTDSPLCEVFQTASTSLTDQPLEISLDDVLTVNGICNVHMNSGYMSPEKYVMVLSDTDKFMCDRCRRFTARKANSPCDRCVDVMATGWE